MKNILSKKAQLYGLSIFIYAIAISITLIIGLVGMSREIEVYSHAGLQRHQAMTLTKNAEIIRTLLDQERTYAVDRAVFYTAAYGGYKQGDFLEDNLISCGVAEIDLDYIGEKTIPYWISNNNNCIPEEEEIKESFEEYIGFFYMPREDVFESIRVFSDLESLSYRMILENFDFEDGGIDTVWIPSSGNYLGFSVPNVEYRTRIYSELSQETRFFELYNSSKEFVEEKELEDFFEEIIENNELPGNCEIKIERDEDGSLEITSSEDCDGQAEGFIDSLNTEIEDLIEKEDNISHKYEFFEISIEVN